MLEVAQDTAPGDVPFSRPAVVEASTANVARAIAAGELKAQGPNTQRCVNRLEAALPGARVLMTGSCTAALELSAILLDLAPGDEVIMPSYGFVSAANAFVLRGAVPVFVDVHPDTLNLDPARVADAVTDRTRAVVPVHYAGVAAAMDRLIPLAAEHGLTVIEDAAQSIGASFRARPLGTFGALGTLSFDATKNVTCGAGGALIVNDPALVERAEWLRDCGTDRAGFSRGLVSRYQWVDVGSNVALNELAAAYLAPQLDLVASTTARRQRIWDAYHDALEPLEARNLLRRPVVPDGCQHNAHAYPVILPTQALRDRFIADLARRGVTASFHFVPLHSSPGGLRFGRTAGPMDHTDDLSRRLVRLPLWTDMMGHDIERVCDAVGAVLPAPSSSRAGR